MKSTNFSFSFYLHTYCNKENQKKIDDETLREVAEQHIEDFGRCPLQIFYQTQKKKEFLK